MSIDKLTPLERLDKLLNQLQKDIDEGRIATACATLAIVLSTHKNLLKRSPRLRQKYNNLIRYCPK
jgi:hypothetical protein